MQILVIIAIYTILYIYSISQINHWLKTISKRLLPKFIADTILIVLGLMPVGAAFIGKGSLRNALETNGNLWFGYLVYLTGFLLVFNVLRFILWVTNHNKKERTHEAPWLGSTVLCVCVLLSLSLNVFGHVNSHKVRTAKYNVTVAKKTTTSGKLKIVLLSDLQLGANTYVQQLRAMVREVNKQKPDTVLIAGNTFNSNYSALKEPETYIEILKQIKAKQGVYAVYGNRDAEQTLFAGFAMTADIPKPNREKVTKFMKSAGIQVLDDMTIYINGVQIVGRKDSEHTTYDKPMSASSLISPLDTHMPILVLQSKPGDFKALQACGVDLALSGRTRNGQYFPFNIVESLRYENSYGLKSIHNVYSVVTSGIGSSGAPIRIGTQSEIAVINLQY